MGHQSLLKSTTSEDYRNGPYMDLITKYTVTYSLKMFLTSRVKCLQSLHCYFKTNYGKIFKAILQGFLFQSKSYLLKNIFTSFLSISTSEGKDFNSESKLTSLCKASFSSTSLFSSFWRSVIFLPDSKLQSKSRIFLVN